MITYRRTAGERNKMKLSEQFHQAVQQYHTQLREITQQYENEMHGLERFKGSAGYSEDVASAQAERDKSLLALRQELAPRLDSILDSMTKAAQARPVTAPTQEQLATLEVLKMREKLSRGELQMAMNSMADCPVALSVLRELGEKHEIVGMGVTVTGATMDTDQVLHTIDTLRRSCGTLLRGETTYSTMNLDGAGLTATINKMACFPNTVTKDHGFQKVQPNKEAVVAFCKAVDGE